MVSIKDVAQVAGVSVSTVSHVINETRFVAPLTKQRVIEAIKNLGFQPSMMARALKVKRTNIIGMLVSSSSNPFFADVVRGVEEGCYQHNFSLILCNSGHQPDRQLANLTTLLQRRIDALLVMTTKTDPALYDQLSKLGKLPKAILDSAPHPNACTLQDDSVLGGRIATKHLIDRGLTKIGCLMGPDDHPRSIERLQGFKTAMEAAHLPINENWLAAGMLTASGGYEAMKQILALETRPDAIFAFNDLMAMGAYRAVQEQGLSIPQDMSIVGYDDVEYASYMSPALTTIKQPSFELGLSAAETLISHLEEKTEMPPVVQLVPELIMRNSVKH
ncbi:substrate-binding domain-containing protein [Pseudovibrio sp. Tun.PSC04-5.I4]|uniref:LacI family DNA-binding transcriptional regulator n=1 Tax=Pseudovibrio sp. Tun.PSC04-5.I4 TaxID=1798213 RepID=UPI00088F473B|nr:substrate-binding domain-containing protein [Pseudovibrio sp. Tun.PSC04-5.I4]SDQ97872.1 transcriptional regulator, LacI family [Pseudovibrio sp. Tun.PSC04-5.I4]